jgi:carboxylate-amine ligase
MPPYFRDAAAYDADLDRLVSCGMLEDGDGGLRVARLSRRWPTVEVRVGDTAATPDDALLYAALARALVRTALNDLAAGRTARPLDPDVLACALWAAARHGLRGGAVDPWQECGVPATAMLAALLAHVRDALEELGDTAVVHALVSTLRRRGPASARQRVAASEGGVPAVLDLLIAQTLDGVPDERPATGYARVRYA